MPELPEVETVKRGLEPVLTGRIFTKVTLNRPNLRYPFPDNMKAVLEGQSCIGLRRRGKYIWVDMGNRQTLVIHLGMSGSFTINPKVSSKHDHVVFETDNGDLITYNDPRRFGMMFFVETDNEHHHKAFMNMGVEPMGNDFHDDYLFKKLKGRQTSIKTALLDQSIIAGIGNIYACESLYTAGINPQKLSGKISKVKIELLVQAIRDILAKAIEVGGSSLRDHKQTDGTMGYFQHSFKVYGQADKKCPETGGIIKKITQSGRSTFYCPIKQK